MIGFNIFQIRIVKKAPQCLRLSLKRCESPANHAHEVAFVLREFSANLVILDPVPNVLVGIEFRTVSGQKVEVEASVEFREMFLRRLRPVRRMAVDDEEDVAAFSMHESVEELTEQFRVHSALGHHETKRSLRRDRADHVAGESLPGRSHHRGLSAFRPCRPRMVIAAHSRLVAEIDLCPDLFSAGSKGGELAARPSPDLVGILLPSAEVGTLGRKSHLLEQPAHRPSAQDDAKLILDDLGDHLAGPKGKREIELKRILVGHQVEDVLHLRAIELPGTAASRTGFKPTPAAGTVAGHPVENTRGPHLQLPRNFRWRRSTLNHRNRTAPDLLLLRRTQSTTIIR